MSCCYSPFNERLKTRVGRFVDADEFMDRSCDGDCSLKFRDCDFVFAGRMLKPIYHFVVVSLRELLPHNAKQMPYGSLCYLSLGRRRQRNCCFEFLLMEVIDC